MRCQRRPGRVHSVDDELATLVEAGSGTRKSEAHEQPEQPVDRASATPTGDREAAPRFLELSYARPPADLDEQEHADEEAAAAPPSSGRTGPVPSSSELHLPAGLCEVRVARQAEPIELAIVT
jgi:hypothetical protein